MSEGKIYNTIKYQLVSEKSITANSLNKYVFKVDKSADKNNIKNAVESIFEVKVNSVRVINVKPKKRVFARRTGYVSGWKKAIVTIADGHTINYSAL